MRGRGPADEGNGGPVTPGADAPHGGAHGTGRNGSNGAHGGTDGLGVVESKDGTKLQRGRIGRIGGLWVVLTLSAIVLVFLLIFIVQNNNDIPIKFLGVEGTLPSGVALLFAAALGVLLAAIPGYGRILQLRRALQKRGSRH
ncbi:MAG: lipopolysaccharide assembly protein LapA domain-containing protein [Pseudonocardia sp.]